MFKVNSATKNEIIFLGLGGPHGGRGGQKITKINFLKLKLVQIFHLILLLWYKHSNKFLVVQIHCTTKEANVSIFIE